jgi:hypothetical protein
MHHMRRFGMVQGRRGRGARVSASAILARARQGMPPGELQTSLAGVRDPAHYRELLAEELCELRAEVSAMRKLRAEVMALPAAWHSKMGPKAVGGA